MQIPKKFVPVALIGLLTSSLLYGCAPYKIASAEGGPVKDELGGVISFAEAYITNSLNFEAVVVDTITTDKNSPWVNNNGEQLFPRGSKVAVIKFVITNTSKEDIDLFGTYVKAWYEGENHLAPTYIPASEAPHVKDGYPEYLVDMFNHEDDTWILPAGESLVFAESFYVENSGLLNVTITSPNLEDKKNKDGHVTSDVFKLLV